MSDSTFVKIAVPEKLIFRCVPVPAVPEELQYGQYQEQAFEI
jgi:hypothetical protein